MLKFSPDDIKSLGFAATCCVAVALLLGGTASTLRPLQLANKELDRQKNVLMAIVGEEAVSAMSKEEINSFFADKIDELLFDDEGKVVEGKGRADFEKEDKYIVDDIERAPYPLYVYKEGEKVKAYVYKQYGMGLWSVVNSYIALETDLATIRGVTFFDHEETPGLGGEVSKQWFMDRFKSKKLFKDGEQVEFVVTKAGKYSGKDTEVEGISGSTITSQGVGKFVNSTFATYNNYFETIRGK